MRHEKLIEKHLGINTPDWIKEKVNNAIDEALGYNLKKSEELKPYIEYHPNGNVRVKRQKNSKGQREGIWEWFYSNGNIKWRTSYKEGKLNGTEELFYGNGNIRIRTPYKEGKRDGIQEVFDEHGNITETYLWKDGKLIEETKPELTPHIEYYSNGNVCIKGQKNSKGQREGLWEWFYENGNISWRTPFKEGKMDGIEEGFYSNGNISWRTPFKVDKIDGIQEVFDEQGNITTTRHWKDGELIEETKPELTPHIEYHPNGNVSMKGQKNSKGQWEGIWEGFYSNGNIQIRTTFKEGKRDGIQEGFYSNGNILCRTPFKEGKRDGIEEVFYSNGNISRRASYKEGKLDGIEEWFDKQGNPLIGKTGK